MTEIEKELAQIILDAELRKKRPLTSMEMGMLEIQFKYSKNLTENILEKFPQNTVNGEEKIFKSKLVRNYENNIDEIDFLISELQAYSVCGVCEFKKLWVKQNVNIYTFEPEIYYYLYMVVEKMNYDVLETMLKLLI